MNTLKYIGLTGLLCVGLVGSQFLFGTWRGAMDDAIREADRPPARRCAREAPPRAEARPAARAAAAQPAPAKETETHTRIRALQRLVGQKLDAEGLDLVAAACGDDNGYVREAAFEVVAKAPPSLPLLAVLIDGLDDVHTTARVWAENGLTAYSRAIPEPTLAALIYAVDNGARQGRCGAARLLMNLYSERPEVHQTMLRALRKGDAQVVEIGYPLLLTTTDPADLQRLIDALWQCGNKYMALAFCSTENPVLDAAARKWAEEHNVSITILRRPW